MQSLDIEIVTISSCFRGEGRIPGLVITEFHRVIIYDQSVRDSMQNVNKFDRLLVEGKIGYMPYKYVSGKTKHGGFIVAHNIQMLDAQKTDN